MKILFSKFSEKTSSHEPLEVHGVQMPHPPGRYQFDKLAKIFKDQYGIEEVQDGVGVAVDLLMQIKIVLERDLKNGDFIIIDGVIYAGTVDFYWKIEILFTFDGFLLHKKTKLIAFTWKPTNGLNRANSSPLVGNHYMLMQGKEDPLLIRACMGEKLKQVADLMKAGQVQWEMDGQTVTAPLTFVGTNDLPAQAAQSGLGGMSSVCKCNWCNIHRDKLMSPNVDDHRKEPQLRTLENLGLLSHLELGTCPGCGCEIVAEKSLVTDPSRQMVRAQLGDPPPSSIPAKIRKRLATEYAEIGMPVPTTWSELHWSVVYALGMLIPLCPQEVAVDFLHLNSCIWKFLFEGLFWKNLLRFNRGASAEELWERVYDLMQSVDVPLTKVSLTRNDTCGVYEKTVTGFSYSGPQCAKLQQQRFLDEMHAIVTPPQMRAVGPDGSPNLLAPGFDRACHSLYVRSRECSSKYKACWAVMNDSALTKHQKADRLDTMTVDFMKSIQFLGQSAHLYPHVLVAHVPKQFRTFKLDLKEYQTQFNEADHQYLKDAGRRLTNGSKPGPAETVAIESYTRLVKGKEQAVKAHSKTTHTKSETEQLMELSVMRKDLRKRCLTAGELALEYQRTLRKEAASKRAVNIKVERDLDKLHNRAVDHSDTSQQ